MRIGVWALAAACVIAVAGCNGGPPKAVQKPVIAMVLDPAPVSSTPPPPSALVGKPSSEPCDKESLAYLIGKPRSQIPVPVDPARRRVACTTCPVTEDYRPDRTDILFDAQTGLVTTLKCG